MEKLFDLRFVIGLFFTVVGLLLVGYHFFGSAATEEMVNLWTGGIFLLFGVFMVVLSYKQALPEE